jgi:hypothetical protein
VRVTRILLVAMACVIGFGGRAAGAGTPSISLSTSAPRVVGYDATDFTSSFTLSGRLSTGRAGVRVVLEGSEFPFSGGFHALRQARTTRHGAFQFKTQIAIATRFRVGLASAPSVASPTVAVYALRHSVRLVCKPCGTTFGSPIHRTFTYQVPAGIAAQEASQPVYVYFLMVRGNAPPSRLPLVGTTQQRIIGPGRISYTYAVDAVPPRADSTGSQFTWRIRACTRDDEASTGFGLPGRHQCGNPMVVDRGLRTYFG